MSVQSVSYLLFICVLWLVAWPLRTARVRQLLFLLASYVFYASWGPSFWAVLLASSLLNYAWGNVLRKQPTARRLWVGIGLNVVILGIFKYLPVIGSGMPADSSLGSFLGSIVMPLGISFWTFQALSYLFDVYQGEEEKPSLLEFCLYMAFWPTVLSGPISRLSDLVPQFRLASRIQWDDVAIGARRIVVGLFMKIVLAQLLGTGFNPGEGVSDGFDNIASGWGGLDVWLLAIGCGFQLFFDFAGYSHIVIGTARLFGIRLVENFDRPYFATTPSVFWTRWHISLSFWIRDYLFFPLATVRRSLWWRNLALVLAMTMFGLWHGATAPFVLWGMYHGLLLVGHRQVQQLRRRWQGSWPSYLETLVSWTITFALISLGWVFFRSNSLNQILTMLGAVFSPGSYRQSALHPNYYVVTLLVVGGYFVYRGLESLLTCWQDQPVLQRTLWLLSPLYYAAIVFLMVVFSIVVWSKQGIPFFYFQF
jgi:alginate O-acetyltransferase complex protein AlgI